ncbi:MAG: RIP metalloprotease RseP [Muribaculaceae bacterium]|nr:RIP metalloprotease RseP [Muribaculaceae bacterium]
MDILVKAAQLVLALVILVTIHEFGHYAFARMFGVKVNRFYLFFNPWFSILKWNPMKGTLELFPHNSKDGGPDKAVKTWQVGKVHEPRADGKPTWRDTIYGLGWLPLGGYCDIAGMIDETKDASQLASEPQSWEFRSKPAWQRLLVMVAGVLLNFVLAIIIYIGIAFHWGDDVIPYQAMTEGMDFSEEMEAAGFRSGDRLLSVDGRPLDAKDYAAGWEMIQPGARVGVLRDGEETTVVVSDELVKAMATKGKDYHPMGMRVPVVVAKLLPGEGAAEAGLQPGDRILKVGTDTTPAITEFLPALQSAKGREATMLVRHADGNEEAMSVKVNEGGKIGIQMLSPLEIFERETVHYSLLSAIPRGWEIGTTQLKTYVSSLGLLFSKEGAQNLGGFGTLGDLFPKTWSWYSFWQITAFLSIILAFMNIIPIPGLDGGHTLFLLVEIITRRKPSDRFLEVANTVGFAVLLLLLVYANGNDIYRYILK